MKHCTSIVKNKKGFTLLESLIAVAMISLISLGMAGFNLMGEQAARKNALSVSAMSFRNTLLTTLENSRAWDNTVNHNAGMACLKDYTPCPHHNNFKSIIIYDENNNLFYDSDDAAMGFNSAGKSCGSYPGVNSDCKLRFDVKWRIICPATGACTNPLVQVAAEMATASEIPSLQQVELKRLSFETYKSFAHNTVQASCEAVGGIYDVGGQTCKSALSDQRCPSGQVVVAVNAVGGLTCRPPLTGQCGAGQVLVGFSEQGFPVCNNLVAQLTPPADSGGGSGSGSDTGTGGSSGDDTGNGGGSDSGAGGSGSGSGDGSDSGSGGSGDDGTGGSDSGGSGGNSNDGGGGGDAGSGTVVLTSVPVGAAVPGETPCHQQLRADAASVNKSSSQDLVLNNVPNNIVVDSARSVDIHQINGSATVHWGGNVIRLQHVHGDTYMVADAVPVSSNNYGRICLLARTVGSISEQNGDIEVDADSVDSIHMANGNVIVHRAQVGSISMTMGNICLHSGATVLNTSNIAGNVTFNCP